VEVGDRPGNLLETLAQRSDGSAAEFARSWDDAG
jgi:hypothetical protein